MVEHKGELHLLLQWYEPAFSDSRRPGQLAKWEDHAMVNMPLLKKHRPWILSQLLTLRQFAL